MENIEKLISDFKIEMNIVDNYDYNNYKSRNKHILKWLKILYEIEQFPNFIEIVLFILRDLSSFVVLVNLAWFLRKYEPILSKRMYEKSIDYDVMSEFIFNNWEKDEIDIKLKRTEEVKEKIKNYNKWKDENKEQYDKIIIELNKILDSCNSNQTTI